MYSSRFQLEDPCPKLKPLQIGPDIFCKLAVREAFLMQGNQTKAAFVYFGGIKEQWRSQLTFIAPSPVFEHMWVTH